MLDFRFHSQIIERHSHERNHHRYQSEEWISCCPHRGRRHHRVRVAGLGRSGTWRSCFWKSRFDGVGVANQHLATGIVLGRDTGRALLRRTRSAPAQALMFDHQLDGVPVSLGRSFVETHRFIVQSPLMSECHPVIGGTCHTCQACDQVINHGGSHAASWWSTGSPSVGFG